MDRWQNRVALVTGASAGIGAAICQLLAAEGMKVVGCARRVEKIEEMAKKQSNIWGYKCDLANDAEIVKMFEWIENHSELGQVDVCVCNAGFSSSDSLLKGQVSDWKKMCDVNIVSLCLCTQLSVKMMIKKKITDGQIVYINSTSGHHVYSGFPEVLFYGATKYAVTALLESWRQELAALGGENMLRISAVSPGMVRSDFFNAMYQQQDHEKAETILKSGGPTLNPEDLARQVKLILEAPKHVQVHDVIVQPTNQPF